MKWSHGKHNLIIPGPLRCMQMQGMPGPHHAVITEYLITIITINPAGSLAALI
jgi:hypothetical protein